MSSKTVTHAANPASSSITTQARSSETHGDIDKHIGNSLQKPTWQANTPNSKDSASSAIAGNGGHSFANVTVLAPASRPGNLPIQSKLTVGEANDKYEQEADQVADKVMRMPEPTGQGTPEDDDKEDENNLQESVQAKPISAQITPFVQRQSSEKDEDEQAVQAKQINQAQEQEEEESLQPKPAVQRQEAKSEDEEEPLQARFSLQRQEERDDDEPESEPLQGKLTVQRQTDEEEEETLQGKPVIQKKENAKDEEEESLQAKSIAKTPRVEQENEKYIKSSRGNGQTLTQTERDFFEPRFGHSFGHVRIHSDGKSASSARQINAQAFTVGNNIFFGANRYQPGTQSGRQLLAHELTHTIQQRGGAPLAGNSTSQSTSKPATVNTKCLPVNVINRQSTDKPTLVMRRALDGGVSGEPSTGQVTHTVSNSDGAMTSSQGQTPVNDSEKNSALLSESDLPESELPDVAARETDEDASDVEPENVKDTQSDTKQEDRSTDGSAPVIGATANVGAPSETVPTEDSAAQPEPVVNLDQSSSQGLLQSLSAAPPSAMGTTMGKARNAAKSVQSQEKQQLQESFPEVERPTGIPRLGEAQDPEDTTLEKGEAPTQKTAGQRKTEPVATEHKTPQTSNPGNRMSVSAPEPAEKEGGGSWWDWLKNRVLRFVNGIPTRDPGLSTSAGKRGRVDLTGDADPQQATRQKQSSDQEVTQKKQDADQKVNQDFGENRIYPTEASIPREKMRPAYQPSAPEAGKSSTAKSAKLPGDIRSTMDQTVSPWWSEKTNEKIQENQQHQQKMEEDKQAAREEGDRKLAEENEKTRIEQEGMQQQGKNDVNSGRDTWREENKQAFEVYEKQSGEKRREVDGKVKDKVTSTESEADTKLAKAEKDADNKRKEAENKASEEKRKAKNKPRSWWDRVKGAVSAAFKAIKNAVNAIFDALRAAVKFIIETAKKAVRALIEVARMAIVGLIKVFGEVLKGLVTVALAAFPGAAAKARAWIDNKVDTAVKAVNTAAEKLKKVTDAILDFVGSALDAVLSLYQKFYNLILDALEFLVVGLMEVLEKIGNLISAARKMPDHFWGQASEEMLGMNLNEPLPMERSKQPSTQQPTSQALQTGQQAGGLSPTDAALLSRTNYTAQDIAVDSVASNESFDPEFIASLNLKEGEEREFGESYDPSRSMAAIKSELAGGTQPAAGAPTTQGSPGSGDGSTAVATPKTPEEELQELMAQPQDASCTKEKPAAPTAKSSDIPESMKKGPFTPGQRARYMVHQMKQGISKWFSCNWPWLLAGAVAALAGFILLNIATGGAVMGALPALMQIVGAIMIGVAVVRVAAYVGEYLSKGWGGDIVGAAKALARGLAIGAIELVFALLFNIGAVIKSLKAGLKASAKAAAKAAKTTVTTTVKNVRHLGRLTVQGGKTALKNGKVMFAGLKSGFSRGVKSLDDLAKRLWERLRFKKFKIRIKNRRFQLLGYINPWVLLADGDVKYVDDVASKGKKSLQTHDGGVIVGIKGTTDDTASSFVKSLKANPAKAAEIHDILVKLRKQVGVKHSQDIVSQAGFSGLVSLKKALPASKIKYLADNMGGAHLGKIVRLDGADVIAATLKKFDEIKSVPGAKNLMDDFLSGGKTARGAIGEISYAAHLHKRGVKIKTLGDVIEGRKAADVVLMNGKIVDVKRINWDSGFFKRAGNWRTGNVNRFIKSLEKQIKLRRAEYPGAPIRYAFIGSIDNVHPDILSALKNLNVEVVGAIL